MLVLSRKRGERITVGSDVVIEITEIKGNRVKVGITAPDNVRVMRAEIEKGESEPGQFGVQTRLVRAA